MRARYCDLILFMASIGMIVSILVARAWWARFLSTPWERRLGRVSGGFFANPPELSLPLSCTRVLLASPRVSFCALLNSSSRRVARIRISTASASMSLFLAWLATGFFCNPVAGCSGV